MLGRDFLKSRRVKVDHGNDKLELDGNIIEINYADSGHRSNQVTLSQPADASRSSFSPARDPVIHRVPFSNSTEKFYSMATKSFDAGTSAIFLFNEVICKYGMIEQVLTYQGVSFEAPLFGHLCKLLGSNKIRSSKYHAQANGGVERMNKVIKLALAKYVDENDDDWDVFLQMTISAHNNTFHSSIGMAPYEAVFGRPSVQLCVIIMGNQLPSEKVTAKCLNYRNRFEEKVCLRVLVFGYSCQGSLDGAGEPI